MFGEVALVLYGTLRVLLLYSQSAYIKKYHMTFEICVLLCIEQNNALLSQPHHCHKAALQKSYFKFISRFLMNKESNSKGNQWLSGRNQIAG